MSVGQSRPASRGEAQRWDGRSRSRTARRKQDLAQLIVGGWTGDPPLAITCDNAISQQVIGYTCRNKRKYLC